MWVGGRCESGMCDGEFEMEECGWGGGVSVVCVIERWRSVQCCQVYG